MRKPCPSDNRGRREDRVLSAHPRPVCIGRKHTVVTTGGAGSSGLPCAMVLTVTSRGPGSFAPVIPEKLASQELDTSVGVSGPHDFAVRISLARLATLPASTASRPAFVTTRAPLLPRRDGAENTQFLLFRKRNIRASRTGNPNRIESPQQISICAHAIWQRKSPQSEAIVRKIEQILPVGRIGLQ
jgi:hypothetical protein